MTVDPANRQSFLQAIDEEADRLEAIVGNLLDLSQVESGRLALARRAADVGQIIRQAAEASHARLAGHRFVIDLPSGPLTAFVDSSSIEQVLRNLLDNAAKYSPGGGTITIRGSRDGQQVVVDVSDEGIGIPESDLERVFERFYRVDDEATRRVGGTGLGLAVCRGIVEAHGGRIWAESELGRGSTLRFALPAGEDPG